MYNHHRCTRRRFGGCGEPPDGNMSRHSRASSASSEVSNSCRTMPTCTSHHRARIVLVVVRRSQLRLRFLISGPADGGADGTASAPSAVQRCARRTASLNARRVVACRIWLWRVGYAMPATATCMCCYCLACCFPHRRPRCAIGRGMHRLRYIEAAVYIQEAAVYRGHGIYKRPRYIEVTVYTRGRGI